VPEGNDFVEIASGGGHNLALRSDGSLIAWGSNTYGQCDVPAGDNFVAVAAGSMHSLSLKSDGSLVAWGYNNYGECNVPPGNEFIEVAAGGEHSLAMVCTGNNICAYATTVQSNKPYNGTTMSATGTYISTCGYNDTIDVWHSFTPKFNYEYTISLCGSEFDTTLAVFDGWGEPS